MFNLRSKSTAAGVTKSICKSVFDKNLEIYLELLLSDVCFENVSFSKCPPNMIAMVGCKIFFPFRIYRKSVLQSGHFGTSVLVCVESVPHVC